MTEWVEPIPLEPPPESSFRVGLCHQHTDEFPPLENATKSLESSRNTVIIPKIEGNTNANDDNSPPESPLRVDLCHQHTDEFPPLENATESQENSS